MYGAVIGDIIGSVYEWHNVKTENFELFTRESRFTDDTVLTVATADAILHGTYDYNEKKKYAIWYKQFYSRYPFMGYGQRFVDWANAQELYVQNSYGNGAAMRITAVGYAFQHLEEVLKQTKYSCHYTHHSREAIRGAQAVAAAVFMAYHGESKEKIRQYIEKKISMNLHFSLKDIRTAYVFDSRASYSVPPAIVAFLESENYEDAIRKAISIGGDSDTIACMAGGIAEAYYKKIPTEILTRAKGFLDIGLINIIDEFNAKYKI